MRHFAIVFIFGLFISGCSQKNQPRTEAVFPDAAATVASPETPSLEHECENITEIIGSAFINFDAKTVLYFYRNPEVLKTPAQTLRFYDDKALQMYSFRAEGEKSYFELNPDRHKLDYFLFDLAVKSRRDGWLEVVVGETKDETLWLQEDKHVSFKDWLRYMKESFAVGRRDLKSNPLHAKPNEMAKEVGFEGIDCFKVEDMRGDWIKVFLQNHCSDAAKQSVSGWIRWRDEKGCLLVEIFPFA